MGRAVRFKRKMEAFFSRDKKTGEWRPREEAEDVLMQLGVQVRGGALRRGFK